MFFFSNVKPEKELKTFGKFYKLWLYSSLLILKVYNNIFIFSFLVLRQKKLVKIKTISTKNKTIQTINHLLQVLWKMIIQLDIIIQIWKTLIQQTFPQILLLVVVVAVFNVQIVHMDQIVIEKTQCIFKVKHIQGIWITEKNLNKTVTSSFSTKQKGPENFKNVHPSRPKKHRKINFIKQNGKYIPPKKIH